MTARETLWYDFAEMLYRSFYLSEYKHWVKRWDKCLTGFILLVSSISISAWAIWGEYPYVWAFLTAFSQIVCLIKPLFHYPEIITTIDLCAPDMNLIISDMESKWRSVDDMEEASILKDCAKFARRYNELDAKYINSLDLPERKLCQKAAMDKRDACLAAYTVNSRSEVKI